MLLKIEFAIVLEEFKKRLCRTQLLAVLQDNRLKHDTVKSHTSHENKVTLFAYASHGYDQRMLRLLNVLNNSV